MEPSGAPRARVGGVGLILLVNPNTVIQPRDLFSSGIPYFPWGIASLAATLSQGGRSVTVVDSFGLAPQHVTPWRRWWIQGLRPAETADRVMAHTPAVVFVFAGNVVAHEITLTLINEIRQRTPPLPIVVFENTQSVTGYALRPMVDHFFSAGATYVLTGEAEERAPLLLKILEQGGCPSDTMDGVYSFRQGRVEGRRPEKIVENLDGLPFPAWPLLPLEGYWALGYGHGPRREKFLPLLTSRGCPYPCAFCVIPETSQGQWRKRSAKNVVDEMAHWTEVLGVREFHVEDVNPSIDEDRLRELARLILERKLRVRWRIVSGMKLEPLRRADTLEQMAAAGCDYLSFSPESGSPRVLAAMKKSFAFDSAVQTVRQLSRRRVRTQACFVVGFPGENEEDRQATAAYLKKLVRAGLDEAAFFVASPLPGSALFETMKRPENLADLGFVPGEGPDSHVIRRWRWRLYALFLLTKGFYFPWRVVAQGVRFLGRRFDTKMEMAPYRALCLWRWRLRGRAGDHGDGVPGANS